jgi:hypothetical protein
MALDAYRQASKGQGLQKGENSLRDLLRFFPVVAMVRALCLTPRAALSQDFQS